MALAHRQLHPRILARASSAAAAAAKTPVLLCPATFRHAAAARTPTQYAVAGVLSAPRRSFATTPVRRSASAPEVKRGGNKVFKSADEAVADIQSGSTILSSGFGLCGTAGKL